jgi:hypothetical protein
MLRLFASLRGLIPVFILVLPLLVTCSGSVLAGDDPTIQSTWSDSDTTLDSNPTSSFWSGSISTFMDANAHGKPDPRYRTEIRTRWTASYLYFLFVCPYEQLNLKPSPSTSVETNGLWNWDVAEVFIGADFTDIRRYKEFEISPQGEWIDLDIDLDRHDRDGWKWNSGFQVSARIDEVAHVWYGAMKIPYASIDTRLAAPGNILRINLFRSQGPASDRHQIAWRATMSDSFHTPERFGYLKLVKK